MTVEDRAKAVLARMGIDGVEDMTEIDLAELVNLLERDSFRINMTALSLFTHSTGCVILGMALMVLFWRVS